jgi:Ni,Fe-hydrogenase III small subunit
MDHFNPCGINPPPACIVCFGMVRCSNHVKHSQADSLKLVSSSVEQFVPVDLFSNGCVSPIVFIDAIRFRLQKDSSEDVLGEVS